SLRHPDGWGIGYVTGDDAYVVKSGRAAHDSDRFARTCARLESHTFVVHVRKATVGAIEPVNAHPLRFGRWLFAHNGTIYGFEEYREWFLDRIEDDLRALVMGDTDSEHLFFVLLSALRRAGIDRSTSTPSDAAVVGRILREELLALDRFALERDLDRPLLNVLLTDGSTFVAHRAGMPLFLSTQKWHCPDAATCPAADKVCLLARRLADHPVNHLLVASEPIGEAENRWEEVVDGTTIVCDAQFRLVQTGPPADWVAPVLPDWARAASSAR
ncbi:MAG: class II glutamine amidotransferase, partial [Myxococcota bacterium]